MRKLALYALLTTTAQYMYLYIYRYNVVNPLYTDIRYNERTCHSDNLNEAIP